MINLNKLYVDPTGVQTITPMISRSIMPYTDPTTNNLGQSQPLPITDLQQPNGLAVDWVGG